MPGLLLVGSYSSLKSLLRTLSSAAAALAAALLFAGCGGSGSGHVSLARLAVNQEAYLGQRLSTSGTVEEQTNVDGSHYYVLADASQNLVILVPSRVARRYAGRRVSVSGRFGFDPHIGRLIRIGRIVPGG